MRGQLIGSALCAGILVAWATSAQADAQVEEFSARINGFQEIGSLTNQTGAILSDGTGTLHLVLDRKAGTVAYKLTYKDVGKTPPAPLTGTVTQAHIHFGKKHVAGGVMVFFCTNLAPPANVPAPPACPDNSTNKPLTGTWTAANVLAVTSQNIAMRDFDALADALTSNTAYANIHTTAFPNGEIRGQIHKGDLDDNHDEHGDHGDHDHK
jgi:hypothetical protein